MGEAGPVGLYPFSVLGDGSLELLGPMTPVMTLVGTRESAGIRSVGEGSARGLS